MKIEDFFTQKTDVEKKCWDYIYRDILLAHQGGIIQVNFKKYLEKNPQAKFPAYRFLELTSNELKKEIFTENEFLSGITIKGNVLNSTKPFFIQYYDELGKPPFMIDNVVDFTITDAINLNEWGDWLPKKAKSIYISVCNLTSLHGIHKKLKSCKKLGIMFAPIKSSILGLMLIQGLEEFSFISEGFTDQEREASKAMSEIINNGLRKHQDVFEVQDALIARGLKEYAKL